MLILMALITQTKHNATFSVFAENKTLLQQHHQEQTDTNHDYASYKRLLGRPYLTMK